MGKCSILRDFVQSIDYTEELEDLKSKSIVHINESDISKSDKHKMTIQIGQLKTNDDLARYLFNALLKFEGHGVL